MPVDSVHVRGFRSIQDSGPLVLGPITVLVGENNAGKSSLLRAVHMLQGGGGSEDADIRIGSPRAEVLLSLSEPWPTAIPPLLANENLSLSSDVPLTLLSSRTRGDLATQISWPQQSQRAARHVSISPRRPNHLTVPVFARRKSETYESVVRRSLADEIDTTDRNLTSRVAELMGSHAAARRYRELLDRVLGLELGVVFEGEGQTPGQQVTLDHAIALSRMGEGVSSVAALLTHLASPGRRLFLVEEPENDLHPTALRNLLLIFREAADAGHQFLVTTHSDIVLRELGAKTDSRIYRVERAQADSDAPPVSSFHLLDDSLDREAALLDLGYEQTAPYGWLLLEEASGETFVRDVLIPLFVPRLSILRTVSSRGTGNLSARLEGLHSMLLFAHLSSDTQRAWVLADGDHAGREAVEKLRDGFNTWPESRFQTLPEDDIEDFYPAEFAEDVSAIRGEGDPRRASRRKGKLAQDVRDWALKNPDAARTALGQSAAALIEVLEDVERQLGAS